MRSQGGFRPRRAPAHHAAPERFTPQLLQTFNNEADVGDVSSSDCISPPGKYVGNASR
jgi:hypothetical protein